MRPRLLAIVLALAACSRPAAPPPPLQLVDERRHAPPPGLRYEHPLDFDGVTFVAMLEDGEHHPFVYLVDGAGPRRVLGPAEPDFGHAFPHMVAIRGATTAVALRRPAPRVVVTGPAGERVLGDLPGEHAPSAVLLAGDLLFVGGAGDSVVVLREGERVATLRPPRAETDTTFGESLAYAGGLLVVGEPPSSLPAQAAGRGRAHVYRREGDAFRHLATIGPLGDELGRAVATDGEWVALGDAYAQVALGETKGMGVVYLHRVSGDAVTLETKLSSREPANWSQFGDGVSLGGGRLAVSAPGSPSDPQKRPGAVHVFERCDGRWIEALVHRTSGDEAVLLGRRVFLAGDTLAFHAGATLGIGRLTGGCTRR